MHLFSTIGSKPKKTIHRSSILFFSISNPSRGSDFRRRDHHQRRARDEGDKHEEIEPAGAGKPPCAARLPRCRRLSLSSFSTDPLARTRRPHHVLGTTLIFSCPCPFSSSHFGGLFPNLASSVTHDLPARGSGGMELKPGLSALVTGGASGIGEQEQRRPAAACPRLHSRAVSIPLLSWCSWARPQSATGSVAWPIETLSARALVSPWLDKKNSASPSAVLQLLQRCGSPSHGFDSLSIHHWTACTGSHFT